MSIQPTERVDLAIIEALDFAPPCEHTQHETRAETHGGDAYAFVHYEHDCGDSGYALLCRPFVDAVMNGHPVRCRGCDERTVGVHTIVALVGGAS